MKCVRGRGVWHMRRGARMHAHARSVAVCSFEKARRCPGWLLGGGGELHDELRQLRGGAGRRVVGLKAGGGPTRSPTEASVSPSLTHSIHPVTEHAMSCRRGHTCTQKATHVQPRPTKSHPKSRKPLSCGRRRAEHFPFSFPSCLYITSNISLSLLENLSPANQSKKQAGAVVPARPSPHLAHGGVGARARRLRGGGCGGSKANPAAAPNAAAAAAERKRQQCVVEA